MKRYLLSSRTARLIDVLNQYGALYDNIRALVVESVGEEKADDYMEERLSGLYEAHEWLANEIKNRIWVMLPKMVGGIR